MATKRVCDRCGAEINPFNSVTYAGMRRVKNDINDNDYELCVSCAHELRKWFNGEEKDNDGRWEYTPQTFNTLGQIRCPFCAWWSLDQSIDGVYKYCPNCGAKMDGGDNDGAD